MFLLFFSLHLSFSTLHAEQQPSDAQFMQMMQQIAAQKQMEEEFKNPRKPKVAGRAMQGKAGAPIQVVAFSDFQCPYCSRGRDVVEELKKKYGDKMVFVFKHLPLPFHPMAMPAAKRFEAIAMQSGKKAYAFHDEVFKNQQRMGEGEKFLDETAKKVGANVDKMKKDMVSDKVEKTIRDDMAEAQSYNINGTPGFVVMGITMAGAQPVEIFDSIIQKRQEMKKGEKKKS